MLGENGFKNFDPEESFAKDAEATLIINKATAEKVVVKEQEREKLLQAIAEAKKEARESGSDKKLTDLIAQLCAMVKIEIDQKLRAVRAEQAK